MLQSGKYYLIFFNQHRNKNYLHQIFSKITSKSLFHGSWFMSISSQVWSNVTLINKCLYSFLLLKTISAVQCCGAILYIPLLRQEGISTLKKIILNSKSPIFHFITKGLQRQPLIGSAVAGFNHAKTIIKASATDLHARQDDYNKRIWCQGA